MFYLYTDGEYYLKINDKTLKLRRVKDIGKASYFGDRNKAISWRAKVYFKYPYMKIAEAVLTLKK